MRARPARVRFQENRRFAVRPRDQKTAAAKAVARPPVSGRGTARRSAPDRARTQRRSTGLLAADDQQDDQADDQDADDHPVQGAVEPVRLHQHARVPFLRFAKGQRAADGPAAQRRIRIVDRHICGMSTARDAAAARCGGGARGQTKSPTCCGRCGRKSAALRDWRESVGFARGSRAGSEFAPAGRGGGCPARADADRILRLAAGAGDGDTPRFRLARSAGEMSEWPKEHAWKACVGATLPRVRIPLSPFSNSSRPSASTSKGSHISGTRLPSSRGELKTDDCEDPPLRRIQRREHRTVAIRYWPRFGRARPQPCRIPGLGWRTVRAQCRLAGRVCLPTTRPGVGAPRGSGLRAGS